MKGLKNLLLKEQKRLHKIIEATKLSLKDAPEGSLRITINHGFPQYYHCKSGAKAGGRYISKENMELVRRLAQKTYDEKVLRLAEKRIVQINKLVATYEDDEISGIYNKQHELRQRMIIPVEPTWEQRQKEWLSKEYQGKGFREDIPVIFTERGEQVRSKSEKIMADYFNKCGIEYKYECPIYLNGVGTIYPDFTFFSKKLNDEVYWEHFGRVDDPTYARNMVRKICAYENNGIYVGEKLILTYETEQMLLDTRKIEQLVKRYLIEE